jgi:EAL domain-containing protein (putative c-di-GMP-specific phosphodiesterase class I)/ActR/RegA family two-component response regulator
MSPLEEPKGSILVVDDDSELLRAHERLLLRAGYVVETASDGRQAADRLKSGKFDAVISDISMPEMDGLALLRAVREIDLDLPVILVTAQPSVGTAAQAVQHGAFRYLLKPVEPELLAREAQRAVRLYGWAKLRRAAHLGEDSFASGDRAGLDASLNRALAGMWMAYQPIVSAVERKVIAYEALMRTSEPSLPFPGAVLRAAERLDRCEDVGGRVRQLVSETLRSSPDVEIFVNLHVRDLLDETLYAPDAPLTPHAKRVVLEITERGALDEVPDLKERVARLRRLGFRIAIDDLGAGFAGLTSFAQLEPDIVKIDMSLTRGVHLHAVKQKLVGSIASVCRDLGIVLVAEGVEVAEERNAIVELGCTILQGYLFARPAKPFPQVEW